MLRIAVITRHFPTSAEPWQGRSSYEVLRVISGQANVQVFFPNAQYPALLKPRSRLYDRLDTFYCPPDVKVHYLNYRALPLLSRPLNGRVAARKVLPHVRAFAPDLILGIFLYPEGYAALRIGQELGIPVVAQSIGSDINRIGDALSAMYTRTVLREVDSLLVKGNDLREKALAMGGAPEKTRSILNGCDTSVFYPGDRLVARADLGVSPVSEAVVYIGRMDVKKGLRELIAAAVSLHRHRPNMHVYLVGEGPDRSLIEGSIQAHNAGDYIHTMPGCAFDEVATWMAAADVVTLPSYMEGCPNVVLEALACGRPVVATNVGGIPEILSEKCGRLVPPRDSRALASALTSALDAAWDAAAISAHGSRSWHTVADELLGIFESLVSARRMPALCR